MRCSSRIYDDELTRIAALRDEFIAGTRTFFGFSVGGRDAELLPAESSSAPLKEGVVRHTVVRRVAGTGLECRVFLDEYPGFPALEWHYVLTNRDSADSPAVASLDSMRLEWRGADPGPVPVLHRSNGSDEREDDFVLYSEEMRDFRAPLTFRMDSGDTRCEAMWGGRDGRSSNRWLPFFNLETGGDGIVTAIGWSERWRAEFKNHDDHHVAVTAGLENFDAVLHPGESIRSPLALLLYWKGEPIHGHNLLRRFIRDHLAPLPEVPVCYNSWGGSPTAEHLAVIDALEAHRIPYDCYWIDAGWYGMGEQPCPNVFEGDWGTAAGDWRVNPHRHPEGLAPISRRMHALGKKFLLWIEPERAVNGTPVTREHPEWFLTTNGQPPAEGENLLLNLGHPGARQWALETVSGLIAANGIDFYREDFNFFASLEALLSHDEPGRTGMSEMRFIEGFYQFWDELLARHPGLSIDNCASGGRRIDLETIRRSLALWRSDYNCFPGRMKPEAFQNHTMGLAYWGIPNATAAGAAAGDTYMMRSALTCGSDFSLDNIGSSPENYIDDYPWDWLRRMIDEVRLVRPYWQGDYYPLAVTQSHDGWMAWQLHLPGEDAGVVIAFRRAGSPLTTARFQLRDLEGEYLFTDRDSGAEWRGGAEADMTIDRPRDSRIWFYRKG